MNLDGSYNLSISALWVFIAWLKYFFDSELTSVGCKQDKPRNTTTCQGKVFNTAHYREKSALQS